MKKCWVYSCSAFNKLMQRNGWTDGNVPEDVAIISILDPDFVDYNLGLYHWFKEDSDNVINLDFYDIEDFFLPGNGEVYGMQPEQAKKLYKFINNNLGKDFYIHCAAGASRSQGVAKYIVDTFPEFYSREESLREDNPCEFPNLHVTHLLKHENFNNSRCTWP